MLRSFVELFCNSGYLLSVKYRNQIYARSLVPGIQVSVSLVLLVATADQGAAITLPSLFTVNMIRSFSTPSLSSINSLESKNERFSETSNATSEPLVFKDNEKPSFGMKRAASDTNLQPQRGKDTLESMPSLSWYCNDKPGKNGVAFSNSGLSKALSKEFSFGAGFAREFSEDTKISCASEGDATQSYMEEGAVPRNFDEYYLRSLKRDPRNFLVLRDYAQYLHETKKNPWQAEIFYIRALDANPRDGETLAQYAKLQWETYGDKRRAFEYFEKASKYSQDCHVLGARASFLWSIEDEEICWDPSLASLPENTEEQDDEENQTIESSYPGAQALSLWNRNEDSSLPENTEEQDDDEENQMKESNYLAAKAFFLWNMNEDSSLSENTEEQDNDENQMKESSYFAAQALSLWNMNEDSSFSEGTGEQNDEENQMKESSYLAAQALSLWNASEDE